MPSDLLARLQNHFGASLLIERELGGGGMSRVFVARDESLRREVVIKLLPEELLGGVGVDRFNREILIAAQLQHPHIVPILSAGEIDGLPYLTMPFVEGHSLRARLIEQGALPIDEAVSVLRDVARALDYAHSRGVVHRDIKPDNVLLSRGTASVTDFGVAKAVSAARGAAAATLTGVGMSIGTPMYMAPEQAAGDTDVDARVDVYAWGVLAYELLAGAPPFPHATPQRQIVAHLVETPVDVSEVRRACPEALAALVMRCLRKDRTERPASAAEILRALSGVGRVTETPPPAEPQGGTTARAFAIYAGAFLVIAGLSRFVVGALGLPDWAYTGTIIVLALGLPMMIATALALRPARRAGLPAVHSSGHTGTRLLRGAERRMSWRRTAIGGAGALMIFALVVASYMMLRALGVGPFGTLFARGMVSEREEMLVADFAGPAGDSTLGVVVSEGVRTSLAQSRSIKVVPVARMASQLRLMELPPTRRVDLSLGRQIAEREGVRIVLDGTVTSVRESFIITIRLHATRDSAELLLLQELARDVADIIPAIDRASQRLRERVGESFSSVREAPRLERVTTASLPALRKYTEGWRINTIEGDFFRAIAPLEEAIRIDTTFAVAYRQAALVYLNAGIRPGRVDTLLRAAFRHRARLPALERALVEASYYTYSSQADRRLAFEALVRAVEADSTHASALNSLGIALLESRRADSAATVFEMLIRTNPDNAFGYTNLAAALLASGKVDTSRRVLKTALRRFPGNANVGAWQRIYWQGDALRDSARLFCMALARGARMAPRSNGYRCLYSLNLMAGKVDAAMVDHRRWAEIDDSLGRPGIAFLSLVDSLRVESWLLDRRESAVRRLDGALARRPLTVEPSDLEIRLMAAETYALAGRPDRSRGLIAAFDRLVPDSTRRRPFHVLRHVALGETAIAEHRYDEAIREFQRADTLDDGMPQACDVCVLPRLGRAFDLADRRREAIGAFEAYLASNYQWRRTEADHFYYAGTLKRLGELYEAEGDRRKAADYLTRFVDLWKTADAPLQSRVADARRRLARLEPAR